MTRVQIVRVPAPPPPEPVFPADPPPVRPVNSVPLRGVAVALLAVSPLYVVIVALVLYLLNR